jgi:hypothetical protein
MFGLLALELIAQGVTLVLERFDAGLQGAAFGLYLPGELDHLPDTGSERIKILQHGRYRKPSYRTMDRKKEKLIITFHGSFQYLSKFFQFNRHRLPATAQCEINPRNQG